MVKDKSIHYKDFNKLQIVQDIFLDNQNEYSPLYARTLCYLIDNVNDLECRAELARIMHSGNKTSKKVFYHLTGIELPRTNKEVLKLFASPEPIVSRGIQCYSSKKSTSSKFCYLLQNGWFTVAYGTPCNFHGLNLMLRKDVFGCYSVYSSDYFTPLRAGGKSKEEVMENLECLYARYNNSIEGIEADCKLILSTHEVLEQKLNAFLGYDYNGL